MKLKEYIKILNQLLKDHPEASEYKVITSMDYEGNSFNFVLYGPQIGYFSDGEFDPLDDETNSVCLN